MFSFNFGGFPFSERPALSVMEAIKHIATRQSRHNEAVNRGNTFAHILLWTVPTLRKTGNPFAGNVLKWADYHVSCGFDYGRKLAKACEQLGLPVREPGKAPNPIETTPLRHIARHTISGKLYLSVSGEHRGEVRYFKISDGGEINSAELEPFKPTRKPTEVAFFRPALSSLAAILINGEWVLVDESTCDEAERQFDTFLADLGLMDAQPA